VVRVMIDGGTGWRITGQLIGVDGGRSTVRTEG
jgi:hypothetical protein